MLTPGLKSIKVGCFRVQIACMNLCGSESMEKRYITLSKPCFAVSSAPESQSIGSCSTGNSKQQRNAGDPAMEERKLHEVYVCMSRKPWPVCMLAMENEVS